MLTRDDISNNQNGCAKNNILKNYSAKTIHVFVEHLDSKIPGTSINVNDDGKPKMWITIRLEVMSGPILYYIFKRKT